MTNLSLPLHPIVRQSRRTYAGHLLALGILLIGCVLSWTVGQLDIESQRREERNDIARQLDAVRARMESQIRSAFSETEGIAQLLVVDGRISPDHFSGMAQEAMRQITYIKRIAVAPGDIVRNVYPMASNERAMGVDLRALSDQSGMLSLARESGKPVLAGPLILLQGDRGLVYRRPITQRAIGSADHYWGSMSVVADVDGLLAAAGINSNPMLAVALRGVDGKGAAGAVIFGDEALFEAANVTVDVEVPNGSWQLAAQPIAGWAKPSPLSSPLFLLCTFATLVFSIFAAQLSRSHRLIHQRNGELNAEILERQATQASLAQSETRFRMLFERSPDAVWIIDSFGDCVQANAAAFRTFGFPESSPLHKVNVQSMSPMWQPDGQRSSDKMENIRVRLEEEGFQHFEWLHQRMDGSTFMADVTLSAMHLGQEPPLVYAVVRDISERQLAQEKLFSQQALLQAIVDNAPSLIYMFDTEARLLLCNRLYETSVRHASEQIVGQQRSNFMDPRNARLQELDDQAVLASGTDQRFEDAHYTAGQLRTYLTTKCPLRDQDGRLLGVLGISNDITEIRQTTEQLRLAGVVMDNTGDGVFITDATGIVVRVNKAFAAITGYDGAQVVGKTWRALRSGRHDRSFYDAIWTSLATLGHWRGEIWSRRHNGEVYPQWLTINAVVNERGERVNYVAVFSDISSIKQSQAQLEQLAHYDSITGLANRVLFQQRLVQAVDRATREGSSLAVLILDVDGFKMVNDTLGHPMGDLLLKQATERFLKPVRPGDTVARLGGDEFAFILNDLASPDAAVAIVQALLESLQQPFDLNGTAALVTASIGVAICPADGATGDVLLRHADTAMYGAKEAGRNGYRFYERTMTESIQQRVAMEAALRRALEREEFEVWYQPKLDLRTGQVDGAEALLRWRDPELGLVMPSDFIPLAERTGLIIAMGEWVLNEVCRQMNAWRAEGIFNGRMAINVAAPQIDRSDFVTSVRNALERHALPASMLEVEVTESLLMESQDKARDVLTRLQALGVTTAVDDFGTGYSSLAYLTLLPIDNLKIDRAFVKDLPNDTTYVAITRAIIDLGRALNFKVTAEGIETAEQCDFLRNAGCDYAQGYLISRPIPAAQYAAWLAQR